MAKVGKNAHIAAARIASSDPAMQARAKRVYDIARSEAAKHQDTGEFYRSIQMKRVGGKVKDYLIFTDHPAALSIEFGHVSQAGRFVDGIHAFGKALGEG